jgi:hypothetical protein
MSIVEARRAMKLREPVRYNGAEYTVTGVCQFPGDIEGGKMFEYELTLKAIGKPMIIHAGLEAVRRV